MNDNDFIKMVINSYLSYATDPHMATLNNTVANRLSDIAYKLEKQEKVLKIIFEKRIDMWHLVDLLDQTYEMYLAFCKSEQYERDYILTQEEFELVKRWLKRWEDEENRNF